MNVFLVLFLLFGVAYAGEIATISSLPNVVYAGSLYPLKYEVTQTSNEPIIAYFSIGADCNAYMIRQKNQSCLCEGGTYTCVSAGKVGKNILEYTIMFAQNIEPKNYNLSVRFKGYDYVADAPSVSRTTSSGGGAPIASSKEERPKPTNITQPVPTPGETPKIELPPLPEKPPEQPPSIGETPGKPTQPKNETEPVQEAKPSEENDLVKMLLILIIGVGVVAALYFGSIVMKGGDDEKGANWRGDDTKE